jgi:aspartyl-tRNA(Asn)/glutamyl-tRNA(Gln) amidotransferase subunit A
MCFAALGTDTGGSIRIPSAFCGTAGLKPTRGRVSLHGTYPLGYTLDHVGPMARSVVDVGIVYQVIAGFDAKDEFSEDRPLGEIALRKSLAEVRMGVPENYFFDALEPEVEQNVRAALPVLEHCGAELVPVYVPHMTELMEASRLTLSAEAYVVHRNDLETRVDELGEDVRALLEKGKGISAEDYVKAQLMRQSARRELQQLFQQVDVIVTPASPLPAFPIGETKVTLGGKEADARVAATSLLRGFNGTGHPALSVCCGFTKQGLPVGLQIVGGLWNEASVLHAGYAYEQATPWHLRRPPLA